MSRRSQSGFTLIEMLVIAPIVILAIGAFIAVIITMTGEVLASRASNELSYDLQDAADRLEQDITLSTRFLASTQADITVHNVQGVNNDGTKFANYPNSSTGGLILKTLVTDGNPQLPTSDIVYLSTPFGCGNPNTTNNAPMTMEVVYFIKNGTLWRRTIMPSNYLDPSVACSTPWQQPSCAPGYTNAFCKTEDIKLVENARITWNYYATSATTTPDPVAGYIGALEAARAAALDNTTTIEATITASASVAGRNIERQATIRATRLTHLAI